MQFLVAPFQPAAGAAGVVSRVQLPVAGRSTFPAIDLRGVKGRAVLSAADERNRLHAGLAQHRSQHRAQCRAACLSKANF
jgi:hypothetical protein